MIKNKPITFVILMITTISVPLIFSFLYGNHMIFDRERTGILLGIFAFSILIINVIISTRPKKLVNFIGLASLYKTHGILAIFLFLVVSSHIALEISIVSISGFRIPTAPAGFIGLFCIILTILGGIFLLSTNFISKSDKVMTFKNKPGRRETGLNIHRLSILALLLIVVHIISVESNTYFQVAMVIYTIIALCSYIYSKIKLSKTEFKIKSIQYIADEVLKVSLITAKDNNFLYSPGQYVFVEFINDNLKKESHPFSIVSFPGETNKSIDLMIKESGDFTKKIKILEKGDVALVEGAYGNFIDSTILEQTNPLIFLAGGIGITPILSILNDQLNKNSTRDLVLIWNVSYLRDAFDLSQFKILENKYKNFKFHIILSREKMSKFSYGMITSEFLYNAKINEYYKNGDFLICGPSGMMDAMSKILQTNGVDKDNIHIEEFSF